MSVRFLSTSLCLVPWLSSPIHQARARSMEARLKTSMLVPKSSKLGLKLTDDGLETLVAKPWLPIPSAKLGSIEVGITTPVPVSGYLVGGA